MTVRVRYAPPLKIDRCFILSLFQLIDSEFQSTETFGLSTLWECGAMGAQETFNFEVVGSNPVIPTSVLDLPRSAR